MVLVVVLLVLALVVLLVAVSWAWEAPAAEYGYWQIDNYAQQKAKGRMPGPKRWVPLPSATKVLSYKVGDQPVKFDDPPSDCSSTELHRSGKDAAEDTQPSMSPVRSDSTMASSSECHVHFCDAAEWIFVDREICGISLHEYAPYCASHADFVSSPFGRLFLQDLARIEATNRASKMSIESGDQDERELDETLKLAGVAESLLSEARG